jgi:hypothetical protein
MEWYITDVLERMWKEGVEAYLKILLTRVNKLRKIAKDKCFVIRPRFEPRTFRIQCRRVLS